MQTAIRGGGGLVSQLRKSYSVGDLHRSGPGGGGGGRAVLHVLDESDGGDYAPPAPVAVGRGRVVLTSLPDVSDSEMEDSLEPVITGRSLFLLLLMLVFFPTRVLDLRAQLWLECNN